ncbi:Hsp20/alpha crystallin family protein [Pseudogracilibacillus auburnensis]|uniref:HSP20 family protein n=1 Tax=Pseudogracilibacillus auburnensis TaxID=1494959 RepID=A0A2V3W5L7_9BACI|nr:Hsp20/alpha crystallin family protein [Pseudogracilibacillus auburnensis]MBO1002225.1 Hsp20/alpha crystallin family protein [Pseudogracilibacillus auburnensis]PXW87555.1 HSP20 family protein [Pseudogracilibacillus auburnensis]
MHSMKPWNPNEHPIHRFRNEMDGMFSRLLNDSFLPSTSFWNEASSFTPKCNIEEKKGHYLVEVEIPGVDPKDIAIELDGNMLTIKGERKRETKTEKEENKMHVVEQSYGSFYRSFTLPNNTNPANIKAENKHGVLFIEIPKQKEQEPRRIDIH